MVGSWGLEVRSEKSGDRSPKMGVMLDFGLIFNKFCGISKFEIRNCY